EPEQRKSARGEDQPRGGLEDERALRAIERRVPAVQFPHECPRREPALNIGATRSVASISPPTTTLGRAGRRWTARCVSRRSRRPPTRSIATARTASKS